MAPDNLLVELFLIALSILAASAAILIPWYSGNSPKPILGGILLIPAGILGYQEIQIVQLEQTLSKAIQTYSATNDLTVSCDRFSQHFIQTNQRAGEVWFNSDGTPENDTRLMYRTCNTLLPLEPQLSAALANSDVPSFPSLPNKHICSTYYPTNSNTYLVSEMRQPQNATHIRTIPHSLPYSE